MRLLIVGAGSTGGYFGARLAQAGREVVFLVRPGRAAQLLDQGLRIESPHGNLTVRPTVVRAADIDSPYDAVLVTVKGFQLADAIEDFSKAVGPTTMILPVLNGMMHMDILAARFTPSQVLGCVAKVSTVLEADGRIVQLAPVQDLAYGELDGSDTPRMRVLDDFFRDTPTGARRSAVIGREMWEKWVLLAALGALTCLMRGTVGEVEASPGGAEFASNLLAEIVAVVMAVGVAPSPEFVASAKAQLTAKGSGFASSMFRDVERRRPVEVDNIIGDLVRRAAHAGMPTPLLSAALTHLSVYQRKVVTLQ